MRFTLILSLFTLIMFSCQDEPKQNGTVNIPDPTDIEIPKVAKIDKSKVNMDVVHRLVLDNPKRLEVGIKENVGDGVFKKSKDGYNTIILSERSKFEYSIEGKEYSYDIPKGTINFMINPSKMNYILEEIVYVNNMRSLDGPFITKSIAIDRIGELKGATMGPFKLIEGDQVISGFDLAPSDEIPEQIAAPGNEKIKRFYKLRRYWKEGDM